MVSPLKMIAEDIFPIAFGMSIGFIITHSLSSRSRRNGMRDRSTSSRGVGIRLGNRVDVEDYLDIERGEPSNTQRDSLARRAPQSTKEAGTDEEEIRVERRELRLNAVLSQLPQKQKRKKRSVGNAPLRGPHSRQEMRWDV
jgi:hypothetical protein